MKLFAKRALLLTVLVLCLFGISVLAASAEVTGATTQDDTHVASFVSGEVTYYYASIDTAVAEAMTNGATEVTVLKDTTLAAAITLPEGQALTITGNAETMPTITYAGAEACLIINNKTTLSLNNVKISASEAIGVIRTAAGMTNSSANACAINLTNTVVLGKERTLEFLGKPCVTVTALNSQLIATTDMVYAANSGSSAITLNFENTLLAGNLRITTVKPSFKNVTFVNDATAKANNSAGSATNCLFRVNNNKVGGDGAYASYTTGYYSSIKDAIAAVSDTDVIYILGATTLDNNIIIQDKSVTIEGTAKHKVTDSQADNLTMTFKLLGTVSLTINNLNLADWPVKNLIYVGAAGDTTTNATINMTNVDHNSTGTASGAIYFKGGVSGNVTLTNCTFGQTQEGKAILNTGAAITNGVTLTLRDVMLTGTCVAVNAAAAGTVNVVVPEYADDNAAIADGMAIRIGGTPGGKAGTVYFTNLRTAIAAAQSGDTLTVLTNTTLSDNVVLGSKTLTIQGVNKNVVLTQSAYIQLNGGVVSLTIKDLTVNNSACFVDMYTSTDAHSLKLENLTINSSRAKDGNILYVSKAKAKIEVVNCTVTSVNSNRFVTVSTSGNLLDFKVTDSNFTNAILIRVENSGIVGSAENPAFLTDLVADKPPLYAYTGTIYVNIYGGTFTGQFLYGGDHHNNTLDIKFNPDGNKTTKVTLNSTGGYYGFAYQNPADATKNSINISFRNTTVEESGSASSIFHIGSNSKAVLTIKVDNSTFNGKALTNFSAAKIVFATDAEAVAFGYPVRVGAVGVGTCYTSLPNAVKAAVTGDTIYVLADLSSGIVNRIDNKKITITSGPATPVTVTSTATDGDIWFPLGDGADLTFTNIKITVKNRFARSEAGTHTLTFGAGVELTTSNAIFFYANGQTVSGTSTANINFLAGSTIKATKAFSTGMIYHNQSKDWDQDEVAESRLMNVNLVLAGKIEMAGGYILNDVNKNGTHTVYYDSTTANITNTAGTAWFSNVFRTTSSSAPIALYVKGTAADTAKLAEWTYKNTPCYAMSYTADPSVEWNYYFFYHSQLLPKQFSVLNSYGGEVWQIRSVGSVYTTVSLSSLGTVTFKSYNGAAVTLQGEANRLNITKTTLILDGIELKAPGSIAILNAGAAATPTTLKLVNGAKLTGTAVTHTSSLSDPVVVVHMTGSYVNLYVDATSKITQTGTLPETVTTSGPKTGASKGAATIFPWSTWDNGEIVIKGELSSTVACEDAAKPITLIRTTSTKTTVKIILDGATFTASPNATTSYTIHTPNGYGGVLGLSEGVALGNANGVTFTPQAKIGNIRYSLADAVKVVEDGETIVVIANASISATLSNITNKTITIEGANADIELTMTPKKEMFFIGDNAHVTFKNLKITADRFVVFKQNTAGASASLTLDVGTHVTNHDLAVDNDILIYNGQTNGNVTINIKAGASVITRSLSEVKPAYGTVTSYAGVGVTLNVWGTLKNIAIVPDGQNAQVFVAKSANNDATLNVYEGAIIEGTSDSTYTDGNGTFHGGIYAGIVYYSEGKVNGNAINVYGGTITIHGQSGFAYTGTKCVINISGGTISNTEAKYPMFYGSSQTATVSGNPTFNVTQLLLKSGTLNPAVNVFNESTYATAGILGFGALYLENNTAYASIASAVAAVADGGTATIYVLGTSVSSEVVINNKNITLVGADITGYHITSTASYTFRFDNLGTLTFKDLRISATKGLIRYQGVASAIASANRDIYINFVNTEVDANGAANYLISSVAHHGDTGSTAADQIKKCDSITVTIDEDSEINFTTSATGEVKVIRYDHNTHSNVYTFIYGDVTVNATGNADAYFYLVRSNNPSTTQITVGEKANISITLAATRQTNGKSYFTSSVGGSYTANKLYLHADAITDDNGNLTLGGVKLYTNYYNSVGYEVVITANNTLAEAAIRGLVAENNSGLTSSKPMTTSNPIVYRAMADGVYYYTSELSTALAKFDLRTTTGGMYFWTSATVNTSYIFNNQTITFGAADGITLTTSAANLFTLTNGAKLTVEDLAIKSTATSTTLATAGTFLRVDDAEATAKCTATLNNVTLTASGLPFYFGGKSVADVTITGGDYTGVGMFSFGIASSDLGTTADVYFGGTVNLTVTGTAEDHVLFTKTGGGDSRAMIFVNSSAVVKDSVKVVFDYVDTNVSGSHTIYLRNNGTLTIDYTNGASTASGWFIGGQGSAVPYATFTNVDIVGTSTDHIMRPYSGTAGAYIKFIGGSITANNVKPDDEDTKSDQNNPILNFNSKMDVLFDGVIFNSTSKEALLGGSATSYTIIDCTFNIAGALLRKTSLTVILRNATVNSVAVTDANAVDHSFNLKVVMGQDTYYATTLNNIVLDIIPDGGTATVQFLARVKAANIIINNKNITFVGKDSTVNDISYSSNANADLYFSGNGDYSITLKDKATVTFRNIAVHADRPLFMYGTTDRTDLAKADRDITLNFENAWVSGGSSSSVFMGGGGTSGTCDAFTVNVDATSKMLFAPSTSSDSTMFYANYTSFASFTVNLNGAIEITDKYTSGARQIWMFNADNAVALKFNVSETASIKFSCTEAQAAANHTIVDQSSNVEMTIAAVAITDENGKSTLGDMDLYLTGSDTTIPQIRITHTSNALETTLRALTANVASAEETPIQYLVVTGGVYNYFNSLDAATAFAQTNGGTVQNLKQGVYADAAAAAAGGMIYRYGGAVVNGSYGVNYFDTLSALVEYAKGQGATEIAVYLLTSDKSDGSTTTLTGVTLTLDSVSSTKQSVKMSGYPVFKLGENAHLVVKNVKILINSGFVDVVAKGETNTAKLDLETNAEIEAPNFTGGYFLYSESTALLTVNLKEGSSIKMQTNGTKTGARQGMFDFTSSGNIVAEGSSITIDGTVIYGLTFDASGSANARRAAMFKMGDKTLDLYFTEHADVQLLHVNAYAGTWNAIVCLDATNAATVVSFNGGKYTTNENCNLIGLNGKSFNGTYTVTGNVDVSGVKDALVYDYATESEDNTTVILFKDVDLGSAKMAKNNRLAYVQLENVMFASDAHAAASYGVKVEGLANYYSLNKAVELADDGSTITLLSNVIGARAVITNKTLTIQGADPANPILITNGGNGSTRIFKCVGNVHLTLKNLEIDAKARLIAFERDSHIENGKTVYDDVASSSLSLINTDVYGVAVGAVRNAMIYVGGGTGHHNFDLHIDANSSVGYQDGTPAEIKSTRNYQVIFYNASVTGDIVIEGKVYSYVYFQGEQVNYHLVKGSSWTEYGPNAQYMISIGNESAHTFAGNIVITETATLTHKVVFPTHNENGQRVYPEEYPSLHSAYAIRVFGGNAGVIVVDGATITTDYQNAYQHNSAWIGFDGVGDAKDITYNDKEATLHYHGVGALLATLNKTDYAGNRITIATSSGSNYNIVYNGSTYISDGIPDDAEATDVEATDAAGYDYYGAVEIAKTLNTLTGRTDITVYADSSTYNYEIVVGIANRAEVQTYLNRIEMNEFAIVFTGNKILVLAWNDAALAQAFESFKSALTLCTEGNTVTLPNVPDGTIYKFVANRAWRNDFTKPTDGTLWGGQYVDSNSLQYVYSGYDTTQEGQAALVAYCEVLEGQGYKVVWQNVIGNNMFRLYQNTTTGLALYVAYNDYEFKSTFYGTNGENGLYAEEETDKENLPSNADLDDEYFENRDHQKVLRVVSMPLNSVTMPDAGINAPDFTYDKVTNTLQTTLSFQSSSVGLGHVYMLEDGRFLVIDGGGTGNTNAGDATEVEAIYNVMVKMYTNAYGHAPTVEQPLHIAAWYLTHTHWDHVSAFNNFASTYGQDKKNSNGVVERPGIVLDYVIANVPVQESVYKNAEVQFSAGDINNLIAKFKGGNGKYIKVCTGQKLYLANLEIEVLMTFMDHAPFDIINTNDTNTVTRFTIYNKLSNDDTLHTQSAQVLYLGDSWRHSSRILCEMYGGDANGNGNYLASDIVQLAHHGNIGCERILYKRIAPTAVYFSHNAPSFKGYVYFNSFSDANKKETVCFRYAANVWCAYNAEYMWSAPYGTYNTLEFLAARPDYEGIKDLFTGTLLTSGSQYDTSYTRNGLFHTEKSYIHNTKKTTTSVNIVWGDLSFTYEDDGSTQGTWNAETHQYEGATPATREAGWKATGDNRIVVSNASTKDTSVNVELKFTAASGYSNFTGTFSDNGTATIAAKNYKVFTFTLGTTALPGKDITDQVIGNVTVTFSS